jgi:hypothetical protein
MSEQMADDDAAAIQEPWWHYTDWFEGLSIGEMYARLYDENYVSRSADEWVVVPKLLLTHAMGTLGGANVGSGAGTSATAALAERIYMALLQRDGYSTEHVKRAWEQAEAFAKRASGSGQ